MSIILGRFGTFVETTGAQTITNSTNDATAALTVIKTNGQPAFDVRESQKWSMLSDPTINVNATVSHPSHTPTDPPLFSLLNSIDTSGIDFTGNVISNRLGQTFLCIYNGVANSGNITGQSLLANANISVTGTYGVVAFAPGLPPLSTATKFIFMVSIAAITTAVAGGSCTFFIDFTDWSGAAQTNSYSAFNALGYISKAPIILFMTGSSATIRYTVAGSITTKPFLVMQCLGSV